MYLVPVGQGNDVAGHTCPKSHCRSTESIAMALFEDCPGHWWLHESVSAADLGNALNEQQAVITDLDTHRVGGERRFSAVLQRHPGVVHWWYFGLSGEEVGSRLLEHGAVPVSLVSYRENRSVRFAVVMQSRPAVHWWYFGLSADDLGRKLDEHQAMAVDITACDIGGQLRFAAILVPRGQAGFWWYYGLTEAEIGARVDHDGGRLRCIRAYDTAQGTRYVIGIVAPVERAWWWYHGQSGDQIRARAWTDGAFPSTVTTRHDGAAARHACILLAQPWATIDPGTHGVVRDMLARRHRNGWHGFYLRRIGGPVMQSFNDSVVFDPASAIKALVHAHAMRAVQSGTRIGGQAVSLATVVPIPAGVGPLPNPAICPFDEINGPADTLPLQLDLAMESMMQRSRNASTEAIRQFFGATDVAATAAALGMADTGHDGATGCSRNRATLVDFGRLYEACSQGFLDATHWDRFRRHAMGEPLVEVVDACRRIAAVRGLPAGFAERFRGAMRGVFKEGRGTDSVEKKSVAGYIALPFCVDGRIALREYVYGVFIDGADLAGIDDSFNFHVAVARMLEGEITAAVDSFAQGACG